MIHIETGFPSIEKTAATFGLSKSRVRRLTALMDEIQQVEVHEARKAGGDSVIPGLGRLKKVQRKARMGRNPALGEPIKIAAKTTAKFHLAKAAKASEPSTAPKSKAASTGKAPARGITARERGRNP